MAHAHPTPATGPTVLTVLACCFAAAFCVFLAGIGLLIMLGSAEERARNQPKRYHQSDLMGVTDDGERLWRCWVCGGDGRTVIDLRGRHEVCVACAGDTVLRESDVRGGVLIVPDSEASAFRGGY